MKKLYEQLKEILSNPIKILLTLNNVISILLSWKNLIIGIILLVLGWCLYWIWKRNREKYYNTLAKENFKKFTFAVMQRYYGEKYFTRINHDAIIPEYCMPVGEKLNYDTSIRDFDKFCNKEESDISGFDLKCHQKYKKNKFYIPYSLINRFEIKRPNHPGFMLKKAFINNDEDVNKIINISVHLGSYAENVYTSDILEYELYEAYRCFEKKWMKDNNIKDESFWNEIKASLEIRNKITEANNGEYNSLVNGKGRQSLISVQMIVVYKDKDTRKYKVHMIRRSDDVAQAPGQYQLVPCGGFDILHESKKNSYCSYVFEENLSPGSCAFREYLEEVIIGKEFKNEYEGQGEGAVNDLVLNQTFVKDKICKMLKEKKASLQFLGSSVSLVLLRHTLSFALIIHDESYSKNQFCGNHEVEGGDIYGIPVNRVDDPNEECWEEMNAGSKASWYLFTQTEEYEDIMKSNSQKDNN